MNADVPSIVAKVRRDHAVLRVLPSAFLEWGLRRVFTKANEVKQVRWKVVVGTVKVNTRGAKGELHTAAAVGCDSRAQCTHCEDAVL